VACDEDVGFAVGALYKFPTRLIAIGTHLLGELFQPNILSFQKLPF
jgi:hypothetical protein